MLLILTLDSSLFTTCSNTATLFSFALHYISSFWACFLSWFEPFGTTVSWLLRCFSACLELPILDSTDSFTQVIMSHDGNDSVESSSRTGSIVITRLLRNVERSTDDGHESGGIRQVAPRVPHINIQRDSDNTWGILGGIPPLGFTGDGPHPFGDALLPISAADRADGNDGRLEQKKPFRKWMSTIRRRAALRHMVMGVFDDPLQSSRLPAIVPRSRRGGHRYSSSGSSYGFVASVKSATVSMATASILARSRRTTLRSSQAHSRTDRSSRASTSGNRASEDSSCLERSLVIDKAVVERSLQRRRILEELINTEESYIGDVRFLMNVSSECPFNST